MVKFKKEKESVELEVLKEGPKVESVELVLLKEEHLQMSLFLAEQDVLDAKRALLEKNVKSQEEEIKYNELLKTTLHLSTDLQVARLELSRLQQLQALEKQGKEFKEKHDDVKKSSFDDQYASLNVRRSDHRKGVMSRLGFLADKKWGWHPDNLEILVEE